MHAMLHSYNIFFSVVDWLAARCCYVILLPLLVWRGKEIVVVSLTDWGMLWKRKVSCLMRMVLLEVLKTI